MENVGIFYIFGIFMVFWYIVWLVCMYIFPFWYVLCVKQNMCDVRFQEMKQGCQMFFSKPKNPNLGKCGRALDWKKV
jgi:hypothetical protein